ncbi:MAG TPA: DUF6569 family protein [Fimbriiglobus sp.]|nr:DUF6569 family protein [Fimbriiglobus sp.]
MSTLHRKTLLLTVLGLGALCWAALPGDPVPAPEVAAAPVSDYRVSGPFTHDNLTVFLLHGPDTLPPRPILTLDEALAKNSFVVHETGTVNTLTVENLSADDDVLIQPGDIVKGGRQDRLIAAAVLVPAKSGQIAVPSFCVEAGRWTQRGNEVVSRFAGNSACIAGKDLKTAALVDGQQAAVWESVTKLQAKLSENVGKPVANPQSPTSLQLALEDAAVADKLASYERELGSVLRGSRRVVGFVIAVNGKVTGAEVFGSSAVLAKAWPKALRSAAVEALAERSERPFAPCKSEAVTAFLADAEKGQREQVADPQTPRELNRVALFTDGTNPIPAQNLQTHALVDVGVLVNRSNPVRPATPATVQPAPVQVNRLQGTRAVLVESRGRANPAMVVHRSYIAK